jgi:hypothetical protein
VPTRRLLRLALTWCELGNAEDRSRDDTIELEDDDDSESRSLRTKDEAETRWELDGENDGSRCRGVMPAPHAASLVGRNHSPNSARRLFSLLPIRICWVNTLGVLTSPSLLDMEIVLDHAS